MTGILFSFFRRIGGEKETHGANVLFTPTAAIDKLLIR